MSQTEIIAQIPKLSHSEKRQLVRLLLESGEDAAILRDCDRLADERFLELDAMEAEDAKNHAR